MTRGHLAAILFGSLGLACGSGSSTEPVDLVTHSAWEVGKLELDPQADHALAEIRCPPGTYGVDGAPPRETFEVTTGDCNFLTASQPALASVEQGRIIHVIVWHLDLGAPLPGPAHAALSIGGDVLWEINVDVPHRAALYDAEIEAPEDIAEGTPVVFHVHNHGTNDWNIQLVQAE